MRNKRLLLQLSLLLAVTQTVAQSSKKGIGDKLPDLKVQNVINFRTTSLKLSEFKGKAVIFDFWNTHCAPCIAALPYLDSMQRMFKDKLAIILVSRESSDSLNRFFNRRKNLRRPSLIMFTSNNTLEKIFPVDALPFHVWVDTTGTIQYLTGGHNATASNIKKFIEGKHLTLKDDSKKLSVASMLDLHVTNPEIFTFYSCMTHALPNIYVSSGDGPTDDKKSFKMIRSRSSVLNLYLDAYSENHKYNFFTAYSVEIHFKDSSKYVRPKDKSIWDEWENANTYYYELLIPIERKSDRFEIMRSDLSRYFGLKARVENVTKQSVIVELIDSAVQSKGGESVDELANLRFGDTVSNRLRFFNQPVSKLISYLQGWYSFNQPFFNEVSMDKSVDVIIRKESLQPINLGSLNEDLRSAGIHLRTSARSMPVLYLSD